MQELKNLIFSFFSQYFFSGFRFTSFFPAGTILALQIQNIGKKFNQTNHINSTKAIAANKSIYAMRADSHILSIISLPFFGFRLDRSPCRLAHFCHAPSAQASLVFSIKFTFFNQQHHQADIATMPRTA